MQATLSPSKFSTVFLILLPVVVLLVIFLYKDYTTTTQEIHNIIHMSQMDHKVITELREIINPFTNLTLQVVSLLFILLTIGYIQLFFFYRHKSKSSLDPNTKVFDRKYYNKIMNTLNPKEYQVLLLQIENFDAIKSIYDENITNTLVTSVANRVLRIIRNHDIFIRFEDANFVIFYRRKRDSQSDILAQRIIDVIVSKPIVIEGLYIQADIKIAINTQPNHYTNLKEAIESTKNNLSTIEINSFRRSHYNSSGLSKTPQTIFELQEALKHQQVVPIFQPIYDLQNMQPCAYELFARILLPNNENIKAKDFIPFITHQTVNLDLDITMLKQAISVMQKHSIALHINLHISTLCHDSMRQNLDTLLKNSGTLPSQLCIEINGLHQTSKHTKEDIKQCINHLKKLGVLVALDNFDPDTIDLKDILYCNPDIVKLNFDTIECDTYDVLLLCKKMNIKTVIKSIQSEEELLSAQKSEANYLQGYFLSEPDFKIKEN
ncbi:MAG: GGDEF domain-containing protein [Campylobacterota bacterium]|nr:GGDEF domain-containing protein [Campylobacterota bacterium]